MYRSSHVWNLAARGQGFAAGLGRDQRHAEALEFENHVPWLRVAKSEMWKIDRYDEWAKYIL